MREYVLSLWGGHTAFDEEITRPGASALVAVVGPLTNGVLALAFWGASGAVGSRAAALVLSAVAFTNVFVAVFNVLPALPMDGGRLLEAVVWRVRGDRELGTLVAARVGQGVAVLVALGSVYWVVVVGTQDWVTLIWGLLIALGAVAGSLGVGARGTGSTQDPRRRPDDVGATRRPCCRPRRRSRRWAGWPAPVWRCCSPGRMVGRRPGSSRRRFRRSHARPSRRRRWPRWPPGFPPRHCYRHHGSDAVAQLARAARAGARFAVLMTLDGRVLGVVDIADAGRRLPR